MKIFYALFVFFICESAFSQTLDCKSMKLGKFESTSKSGVKTLIERTENTQFETIESMKYKSAYDLVWIDDCSYELRNPRVIEGETGYVMKPQDYIKIEIIQIEGMKATIRISSNFSTKIAETTIYKIP